MKSKRMCVILVLLAGIFSVLCLDAKGQAKNGVIRGRVADAGGLVLPAATVYLEELKLGVASDINGYYVFTKVPEGKYHLKVSYVGYKTQRVTVNVEGGKTLEKNFKMESDNKLLSSVFVGGTFWGYQRATNYRKSSLNLRDVVSADQVGRFPDANIGDAMKRIPGINVQYDQGEARFGQIRGTSPDFSSVTINGNRLPSAEGDIRNVQLDLIPADMIQTIVVNKVVTPDMDGDAIGGSVNLVTKSSPVRRMINATLGTGYNMISDKLQLNAAFTYGNNFFNNKLGMIVAASYQNNPIGSDNTEFEWSMDDNGKPYVSNYEIRQYFVHRERQSYSLSLDYKFNPNHRVDFKGIYNRRNDWENRFAQNIKDLNENGEAEEIVFQTKAGTERDARLERQQTMDFALNGEHLFGTTLLNWNFSVAKATEERPDERYIAYKVEMDEEAGRALKFTPDLSDLRHPHLNPANPGDMVLGAEAGYELDELTEQQEDISEDDIKGSLNLNVPIRMGNFVNNLRFGAKIIDKHKKRDLEFYDYTPVDEDAFNAEAFSRLKDQTRSDFYADGYKAGTFVDKKFLGSLDLNNSAEFEKEENLEEISEIFKAHETVTAGYVRYDHHFSPKFQGMVGVRLENTHLRYQGKQLDMNEDLDTMALNDTPELTDNYVNVLPSVIFKYDASPELSFRLSYTNTIARPKYFDLVPHVSVTTKDGATELSVGNSELKPTLSYNVDFGADYTFDDFGIVSAGFYYKHIDDFIVTQTQRDGSYNGIAYDEMEQPLNAGKADLWGLEFAWQKDFAFIAPALKYFGLYANYTYTHSTTDLKVEREDENGDPLTDEDLPMPGSPKHLANVSLYFERAGLNIRASYNHASDFIDELAKTPFEDSYYDKVNYLDANISYTFAKHYTVYGEATNLLNQPLRYYQGSADLTKQVEYYGPKFNIGFKVNF